MKQKNSKVYFSSKDSKKRFLSLGDITAWAREKMIPLSVAFEITYRCNLRCCYCFNKCNSRDYSEKKELTFQEIASTLDQLAEAGSIYLDLSGGEPMIRKDFFKIAWHARRLGFALTLFTNGTCITKESAAMIADLFPFLVKMSLYGPSEDLYGRATGNPHLFSNAMRGLSLLAKYHIPLELTAPIFNHYTPNDVLALKKIAKDLGIVWKPCINFTPTTDGDCWPFKYMLSESQYEEFCQKIPELALRRKRLRDVHDLACRSLRYSMHITPYGQVGSCNMLVSKETIREKSPLVIWKDDPLLKAQRGLRLDDLPKCAACEARPFCKPCPAANFSRTGSFSKMPKEYCQFYHMANRSCKKLEFNHSSLTYKKNNVIPDTVVC